MNEEYNQAELAPEEWENYWAAQSELRPEQELKFE